MTALYTIGHSTRDLDEVIELLKANEITVLCDVRSYPGSRRYPHWNKEALTGSMPDGIRYVHLRSLGGRRKALPDSRNDAWRNVSFRGYADHMQTDEFKSGLDDLLELHSTETVAIMCSEAVPWRCHRSMITDALLAQGIEVHNIISTPRATLANMTPFARVQADGRIIYPVQEQALLV